MRNQKSTLVKFRGLKLSTHPSLMRMMMKRWSMKALPANPGLEASLSERDVAALLRKPMKNPKLRKIDVEVLCKISNWPRRPNFNLSKTLLWIFCNPPVLDGPESIKVEKETVDTEQCFAVEKVKILATLATVILPEKLASWDPNIHKRYARYAKFLILPRTSHPSGLVGPGQGSSFLDRRHGGQCWFGVWRLAPTWTDQRQGCSEIIMTLENQHYQWLQAPLTPNVPGSGYAKLLHELHTMVPLNWTQSTPSVQSFLGRHCEREK